MYKIGHAFSYLLPKEIVANERLISDDDARDDYESDKLLSFCLLSEPYPT